MMHTFNTFFLNAPGHQFTVSDAVNVVFVQLKKLRAHDRHCLDEHDACMFNAWRVCFTSSVPMDTFCLT